MDRDIIVYKTLFIFIIYGIYYNLVFLFLNPLIYQDLVYLIYLLILYGLGTLDTILRPLEMEKKEEGNYARYIAFLFLINPFLFVFALEEQKILILNRIPLLSWMGLLIYLSAATIVVSSRVNLGKQALGVLVIREEHELITTGLYSYIRHPMYAGTLLGVIGFAFVSHSIIISVLTMILYVWVFLGRIKYEEMILEETFGKKYQEYKLSTYRLIPFIY